MVGGDSYEPFEGILLTDTFELHEKDDLVDAVLKDNSARRKRQRKLDIRVIVGNPPYSVGQANENDNNQNVEYPMLDARLAETYAARSDATNKNKLYDSYIRAIRWASDRIGDNGIIGFVTNAGFVDTNTADGMRKCLAEEFSSLYVFHLRGNQRTAGELSRREGGKVFGSGSRAPVAISLLVKNPNAKEHGVIYFRDVGDYLTREQKLEAVSSFASISGISAANGWTRITPDAHGDWLKQRDLSFERFILAGDKASSSGLFANYSNGVVTARDAWVFGTSKSALIERLKDTISFYNSEVRRFDKAHSNLEKKERRERLESFVSNDPTKISWSTSLKDDLARGTQLEFVPTALTQSLYRPYTKQWLYFGPGLIHRPAQLPKIFRSGEKNLAIMVKQRWSGIGHLALMVDVIPEFQIDGGAQNFPLYIYDEETGKRRDGITDAGLEHFESFYPSEKISKEDIFYYAYGVLHSPDYRERYADNLGKELPRIPRVSKAADFWAFSKAGRKLGELHVGFEQVPEYSKALVELPSKANFRVERMRFGKGTSAKEKDKTVIQYNDGITVRGIPLGAYEYVVNGKSAIEWVMERQAVTTDADSGIVKNANDYAKETMKDSRYPLSLLLRVITVSLETVKLVKELPRIDDAALARENKAAGERKSATAEEYGQQVFELPLAASPVAGLEK